jgi:hypothetical protein
VSFFPTLYSNVLPWNVKGEEGTKDFAQFVHKFANHVIRITNAAGTVHITDLPITTPSPTGTYTCSLTIGDYLASVIPVSEASTPTPGSYTEWTTFGFCANRAAIGTVTPVAFSITGTAGAPVILNCITAFRVLEYNIQGTTYQLAGIPQPNIVQDYSSGFFTAHNPVGSEQSTYSELQTELANHNLNMILADASPVAFIENDKLWWDAVSSIYYLYTNGASPSYTLFDLAGGTGATMPVIWNKDAYNSRTWIQNTALRLSYSGGIFTVNQSSWFSTIITK